jgi:hypothetical protein
MPGNGAGRADLYFRFRRFAMGNVHKQSRATDVVRFQAATAGVTKNITTPIQLDGQTMTPQAINAAFNNAIQADQDLDAVRAQEEAQLQARNAAVITALALLAALLRYAQGIYGKTSPTLQDFGFPLSKPAVKTVKVKAQAVELSAETRKLRHTMGSKQKAEIKAQPVTAGAAPVAAEATPAGTTKS